MKKRGGFVANSSSSSFMIAVKGELKEESLMVVMGVGEDSFFYQFAKDICSCLVGRVQDKYENIAQLAAEKSRDGWTWKEMAQEGYYKRWFELLEQGWTIYEGFLSDEGYGDDPEAWLCMTSMNYESENLIVEHEGGY